MDEISRLAIQRERENHVFRRGDRLARIIDFLMHRWLRLIPAELWSRFSRDMERLKRIAVYYGSIDPLTGLLNRRSGERQLREAVTHERTSGLGLLFLDINWFKQLNDNYGHDAGDCALRAVGEITRGSVRTRDLAIRWGGEEILIVFLTVHNWVAFVAAMARVMLDLHNADKQKEHGHKAGDLSLASGGVWIEWATSLDRRRFGPRLASELVGRADERMFESKIRFKEHGEIWMTFERLGLDVDHQVSQIEKHNTALY